MQRPMFMCDEVSACRTTLHSYDAIVEHARVRTVHVVGLCAGRATARASDSARRQMT